MTALSPNATNVVRESRRCAVGDLPGVQPDGRTSACANVTPNWFAIVMGTGLVASASTTIPMHSALMRNSALVLWLLAVAQLLIIGAGFAAHWIRHTDRARRYANDPLMANFYGAPAMALLTVGSGTLVLGSDLVGHSLAVRIDVAMWLAGTAFGVGTAVSVPYMLITRHAGSRITPVPAWLMPVVPPMVSATAGALLVSHLSPGQWRTALFLGCYGLFGLSLVLGMMTMTLIYGSLLFQGAPSGKAAPTIWITLGVVGQSVTAIIALGRQAQAVLPGQYEIAAGLRSAAMLFGLVMAGFGVVMFILAAALTVRAFRYGMPFSLSWWSFTFPIGTCVTGVAGLATAVEFGPLAAAADAMYVGFVMIWTVVFVMTVRGVANRSIFRA